MPARTRGKRATPKNVIARSAATKQSQGITPLTDRLLRFARNDSVKKARNDSEKKARNDSVKKARNDVFVLKGNLYD
jgi:hypothetical protein